MIRRVEIQITSNAREQDREADGLLARLKALRGPWAIKLQLEAAQALAELQALSTRLKALSAAPVRLAIESNAAEVAGQFALLARAENSAADAGAAVARAEIAAGAATAIAATQAERAARAFLALGIAQRAAFTEAAGPAALTGGDGGRGGIVPGFVIPGSAGGDRGGGAGSAAWTATFLRAFHDGPFGGSGGGIPPGFFTGLLSGFGLGGGKGRGGGGFRGPWGIFGLPSVPLFGGLGSIGGFHLLAQGILEISATLIPATVAMVAFGVAGTEAAETIVTHFQNAHTVMYATNQVVAPLTGSLDKLHDAARPAVFQLLGDAMTVMNKKAGAFSTIALAAGNVIEQLAARATVALTSGGLQTFLQSGATDLAKWGTLVGNIFGIFGNLLRSLPGYANYILTAFDGLTHGIEVLTAQPLTQWLLRAGLGMHGFFVYAGLAATGVMALVPWASRLVTVLAGAGRASTALRDLGTAASAIQTDAGKVTFFDKFKAGFQDITGNTPVVIGRLKGIGVAADQDAAEVSKLARAGNLLATGVKWGIVAGALIGTVSLISGAVAGMHHLNDATAVWLRNMQTALEKTPLTGLLGGLLSDSGNIQGKIQQGLLSKQFIINANPTIGQKGFNWHEFFNGAGLQNAWNQLMSTFHIGSSPLGQAQAQLQQYRAEATILANQVLPMFAKQVGGNANAFHLFSAAGITSKQMLDALKAAAQGNDGPLKALEQRAQGTANGFKAMHQYGGILGNDLQVLDQQSTPAYQAVQRLNQGWDTFIGNVTASQNSFDTFALGMKNLTNSATAVRSHLGSTTLEFTGLGHAMDGLTKRDLALNQAFTQQVGNANATIDTWRQAGLATDMLTRGVKGSVAELLRFAKGSPEALAQLTALAEEAGYNGPASFSALSKWVGTTQGALQRMKDAANQATIQEALLSSSMKGQGNLIASQLLGDLNNATLKYYGVQKAAIAYGDAIAKDGQQSQAARAARANLIDDLIKSGKAAHDTTAQIAAMITKVTGIPTHRAIQIVESGVGTFKIAGQTINQTPSGGRFGGNLPSTTQAASGMYVHAGTTPTADDVLARVSRGELIVPAHMVSAGMVDHLRGRIPGFAGGGTPGGANPLLTGNLGVLSGQAAVDFNNSFISQFTSAMEHSMSAATRAAMQAAVAAMAAFHGGGPAGGSASAAARYAMSLLGRYGWSSQWAALNSVAMAESGWRLTARNPSSGAYGIAQFINGPSEYYQYGGNPNSIGGQVTAFLNYIRQRYGSPNAAWAHESAFHWYHDGVRNAMFTKPTIIGVGDGGPELVNVTPLRGRAAAYAAAAGGGGNVYITVAGDSDPDAAARHIWLKLRDFKRHQGGKSLGL